MVKPFCFSNSTWYPTSGSKPSRIKTWSLSRVSRGAWLQTIRQHFLWKTYEMRAQRHGSALLPRQENENGSVSRYGMKLFTLFRENVWLRTWNFMFETADGERRVLSWGHGSLKFSIIITMNCSRYNNKDTDPGVFSPVAPILSRTRVIVLKCTKCTNADVLRFDTQPQLPAVL